MDIYQIWTTYNPIWSEREIVCFTILLLFVSVVVEIGIWRHKWNLTQGLAMIALYIFLGIVFASTVFTRAISIRQYELKPFWSWYEIICNHDMELLKENFLNFLLLAPVGLLLPMVFNHKIKLNRALLVGFLISAVIEVSQLIFKRGLFEWDDMIHNSLGCMLGCWIMNRIISKLRIHVNDDNA